MRVGGASLPAYRLDRPVSNKASLAAALLIVAVLGLLWPGRKTQPLALFDQQFYLGIAADLREHGRFTDGYQFAALGDDGARPSGLRFAPLYPTLLAALASLDPGFRSAMACIVSSQGHDAGCSREATAARTLQVALLAGSLWLIWWMAAGLGGAAVGWLALLVALLTAPMLLDTADWLMTETLALALSTAATAAAVEAIIRPSHRTRCLALCGGLLGFAVLTKPGFLYLALACLLAGAPLATRRRYRAAFVGFAVCLAGVLAPWFARNLLVMHRLALTHGYDSHTLVQRLSFDAMSWREYRLSFVCWLPDGNALGRALAGRGACDRFGWSDRPDTFYRIGLGPMLQSTLAAAGGYDHHLGYLLRRYILPHPLWYAAVSLPLALRGAWIDHDWGLVLGPICLWHTIVALRDEEAAERPFLAIALPAWFMLAFNASVAVNQTRYNLMLVPAYAIAGGLLLGRALPRRLRSGGDVGGSRAQFSLARSWSIVARTREAASPDGTRSRNRSKQPSAADTRSSR